MESCAPMATHPERKTGTREKFHSPPRASPSCDYLWEPKQVVDMTVAEELTNLIDVQAEKVSNAVIAVSVVSQGMNALVNLLEG